MNIIIYLPSGNAAAQMPKTGGPLLGEEGEILRSHIRSFHPVHMMGAQQGRGRANHGIRHRVIVDQRGIGGTDDQLAPAAEGQMDVLTLLVKCGLCASRGEARRLVQQGGVSVDGQKVGDIEAKWSCKDCAGDGIIIKKGKKVYHKAILEQ